jgi:hypothetical protein
MCSLKEPIMKTLSLTLALFTAFAAPALAFPTGVELPTITWPDPVVASQACVDPAAILPPTCNTGQ